MEIQTTVVRSPFAFDPTTSEGPKREGRDLRDSLSALLSLSGPAPLAEAAERFEFWAGQGLRWAIIISLMIVIRVCLVRSRELFGGQL